MNKEIIDIDGIKKGDSFNHVVKANGLLFLTSQLSADLKTGTIIPGDITEQTKRAMDNIKYLIESCGGTMDDIVKMVIYMKDTKDRQQINEVYKRYFTAGQEPAKVSVQAPSPIPSVLIEIEATAIAHSSPTRAYEKGMRLKGKLNLTP